MAKPSMIPCGWSPPRSSQGLPWTSGHWRPCRGPVWPSSFLSVTRSHRALAVAVCPEGSLCIHSRCPGTPRLQPPQNSLSPQEALRETSCYPELLAYWGCYPEWDRTLPEKQLGGGESLREREGGRGRKLGWPRAGAASCVEWGPPPARTGLLGGA